MCGTIKDGTGCALAMREPTGKSQLEDTILVKLKCSTIFCKQNRLGFLKMKHKVVDMLFSRSRHQSAESTITKSDDDFTYDDYKELLKSINANNIQKKLSKIQNFNFTDPLTKNTIIHAALDGTIKSTVLFDVLLELHNKGAQIDQPNINGDLALHFAVKNDISEAIDWFYRTNCSLLQHIHSKNHLNLAHYALAYGSFQVLKSLHEKQPELISQTITEGALKGYAPITYFLTTLFCKVDVHQDQYLPPKELNDILTKEQHKNMEEMEPARKIIEENENLKSIMDFLLANSPVDTYLIPTKFGTVLHVLVRINYFEGMEKVIEKMKTQDERLLENIFTSKDPSKNKTPLFCALERSVDEYKAAR